MSPSTKKHTDFWIYNISLELNLIFVEHHINKDKIADWIFEGVEIDIRVIEIKSFTLDEAIKVFRFIEKAWNLEKLLRK